jgi:signal transduction histidine kinase
VRVSPEVLDEILDVLLDNADRHGRGAVRAEIDSTDAGHLTVTVVDDGHLVTSQASLFARREPGLERHGLGLALARSLAEAEGGRLVLAEPDPTTFRLVLPDRC